jgi:hypothetical protein
MFIESLHRQVNVRSAHCEFLPWALLLAIIVAGMRREEKGYGDRVTEWVSAGPQSILSLWRGAF